MLRWMFPQLSVFPPGGLHNISICNTSMLHPEQIITHSEVFRTIHHLGNHISLQLCEYCNDAVISPHFPHQHIVAINKSSRGKKIKSVETSLLKGVICGRLWWGFISGIEYNPRDLVSTSSPDATTSDTETSSGRHTSAEPPTSGCAQKKIKGVNAKLFCPLRVLWVAHKETCLFNNGILLLIRCIRARD